MADYRIQAQALPNGCQRKLRCHTFIKDHDLQIDIPSIKEIKYVSRVFAVQGMYECFNRAPEFSHSEACYSIPFHYSEDLGQVMEDAQTAYDSIMDIQKRLNQAYHEFIHMQSN